MTQKQHVVLAGRSERALKLLADALTGAPGIVCSTHLISDGHADVLSALQPLPDVLVLRFDGESLAELTALADSSPDSRPPLVLVGPAGDAEAMRLAVRIGARDFLPEPVRADDLRTALERVFADASHRALATQQAQITVVLGAAGGVGVSTVACNLAVALATETRAPVLLLDLDLNTAPLASFLDLNSERGLAAALAEVEYLDEQALQGYVTRHRSGLRVMSAPSRSLVSTRELDPARFVRLLSFLSDNFRHIVVDGSHTLDDLTVAALGAARSVVLVLQQSVVQVKQAARVLGALRNEIGVADDRILVVVNRHLKRSAVALKDIRRALDREELTVLPGDYKAVLASIDTGVPLFELDHSAALVKGILDLQRELCGGPHVEHHGLLHRALPIFAGD